MLMRHIPITNNTDHAKYYGRFRVAPGETRIIDAAELPPHLQEPEATQAEPEAPHDPLLDILDGNITEIAEALPGLSEDELNQLEQAERDGNTRKGVEKAIAEERLVRAGGGNDE